MYIKNLSDLAKIIVKTRKAQGLTQKDVAFACNVGIRYIVDLENGKEAYDITIPYSDYNTVEWKYNSETKRYTRYSKSKEQKDWTTNENVTTKNIIIEFIANSTLNDGENKGRQTMNTTGTKDGYYITNGKAIPIKCEKVSRSSKTVYKDLEGNEIKVNDGNTFVQICPINAKVKIESNTQTEAE